MCKKARVIFSPKVNPAPLGFNPHPSLLSGSDHSKSHYEPSNSVSYPGFSYFIS